MKLINRLALAALATLALSGAAQAQQQFDPGGKARVSTYCKTTVAGDTPCAVSGGGGGGGGAVYGPTATGAAAANPPVVVGGTINGGATGNVQGAAMKAASTAPAATDPAIVVALSPNGAQATAANQATANASLGTIATNTTGAALAANQTSVIGTKAPGTAAANSLLVGGVYNSSDPTLTNGQQASAQLTAKGEVRNHDTDLLAAAQAGTAAPGAATPGSVLYVGANSGGLLTGLIQADVSVPINISTATDTQLIALSGSKKIYVSAWDVIAAGTGNIQLEYGTGSNCGTGTTALTGNYNLTAQAGISKGNGLGVILVVPAGNALCVKTSAAVGMAGSLSATQF